MSNTTLRTALRLSVRRHNNIAAVRGSERCLSTTITPSSSLQSKAAARNLPLLVARSCFGLLKSNTPFKSTLLSRPTARTFSSTTTSSSYPEHTLFPMPALSPTMESGSIGEWKLKQGDAFAAGDVLCSIETDKATVDFEAQDDGILAKILVSPGTDIAIGTPICVVVEDANDVAAFADFKVNESDDTTTPAAAAATAAVTEKSAPPPAEAAKAPSSAAATTTTDTPSLLLPSARHLAESKGKDATVLKGSGKGGRVTKGDVLAALEAGAMPDLQKSTQAPSHKEATAALSTAPSTPVQHVVPAAAPVVGDLALPEVTGQNTYEDVTNNKMRKIIAKRLTESKREVPHSYASMEVALDNVLALRKQLVKNHDIKVSVNDFIIRCSALALRDVPEVNGTFDSATGTVKPNQTIDVSVAVATPTGLITPIVFGTDRLGLAEISATVHDLAGRARRGALAPHEYQGGSFSVSNLGMFGIAEFSAVINPPQCAILAVGGSSPQLVPTLYKDDDDDKGKKTSPKIQSILTARLSADRRVVDEATAALFLQAFRHYIEKPELLIL